MTCIGADGAARKRTRTTHGGFWSLGTAGISEFHDRMIRALGPTRSTTDLPVAMFYEELARAFPDARTSSSPRAGSSHGRCRRRSSSGRRRAKAIARNRNVGFGTNQFHHHIHRKNFVVSCSLQLGRKVAFCVQEILTSSYLPLMTTQRSSTTRLRCARFPVAGSS